MNASVKSQQIRILQELGDARLSQHHRGSHLVLWVSVAVILLFIGWAAWAEIDEVTRGEGRVIPYTRLQKIQSLEGGILEKMLVREGELVEAGQPLLQLDHTRFYAAFMEGQSQTRALRAAIARLEAEVQGLDKVHFPDTVEPGSPEAIDEGALFLARRSKHQEAVAALREELAITEQQLALIRPLVARRAVSEVELLRLQQNIASLKGKMAEISNAYMQDAYTELTARKAELSALEQALVQREDQLRRTELVSPVKGMVNNILVTTRGGVIQPGEAIMEILPVDDHLLIEAKVKPQDVAFLAPGMEASVKITAYDYTIYGDLRGVLEQISADTMEEETVRGKEHYYQIQVRTQSNYLERNGEVLPIRPGMVAQVDVLSGKRTVLSYLLKPLIKARLY